MRVTGILRFAQNDIIEEIAVKEGIREL